mmetsp:Transcript_32315/g.58648  ORF Transcript_32315/g.58648 Transcript_32315/m.58648 type:complete len:176 (+) Transcript_32315:102-629(+)
MVLFMPFPESLFRGELVREQPVLEPPPFAKRPRLFLTSPGAAAKLSWDFDRSQQPLWHFPVQAEEVWMAPAYELQKPSAGQAELRRSVNRSQGIRKPDLPELRKDAVAVPLSPGDTLCYTAPSCTRACDSRDFCNAIVPYLDLKSALLMDCHHAMCEDLELSETCSEGFEEMDCS